MESSAEARPRDIADEALMARIQADDRESLACLFQRYAYLVRVVSLRILKSSAEAEDFVQDLFLFIQRKAGIFDRSKSSARSWIVQMAYQRAIERRRYLAARHFYARNESQDCVERVVGKVTIEDDYSPEAVFGRNGLEKVFAALSDYQRETLRLYFFDGYTLSAIYGRTFTELLSYFGLRVGDLSHYRTSLGVPKTHLLNSGTDLETGTVSLPVRLKPEFQLETTNLLARVVEKWDQIPVGFLQHLDLRKSVYGYIGLEDYTLFPLIRPGSLVQIDSSQQKIASERWKTEFDRPIYFVELRDGYVCSWCQIDRGQLIVIPHPHSHQDVRRFDYPSQAEIVGRVTGVTMCIVDEKPPEPK
ncbi:MAG TPA: sigma-70 family RNA polymerase sigma factor, partial [Blastocatellia bacterium]|nr:sigma-70 family RNA polymerase sigma factor [Blastocatellia bacterium]